MITIFTDGAARGNPGRGGWATILVFPDHVKELGGREDYTTNNRMELRAAIEACSLLSLHSPHDFSHEPITIYTDSSYLINGITKWVFGWIKKGWITSTKEEVINKDLWQRLSELTQGKKIEWKYVGGHVGVVGNERCDEIATSFADQKTIDLYDGPAASYTLDILNIDFNQAKKTERKRSGVAAFSYVSKVDGIIKTHQSWAECEARVKGKGGAQFKKVLSEDEEKKLIEDWSKQ